MLQFIGGGQGQAANGGNVTLTMPAGIAQDDIAVILYSIGSDSDRAMSISTSGYTELFELWTAGASNNVNFGGYYSVQGATPDSSVVCVGDSDADDGVSAAFHVWRGVDTGTPIDATTQTTTNTDTSLPNQPSITTVTDYAVVIAGFGAGVSDSAVTAPALFGNQFDGNQTDGFGSTTAMISTVKAAAGAIDPPAWSGISTVSRADCTIALRPAAAPSSPILHDAWVTATAVNDADGVVTMSYTVTSGTDLCLVAFICGEDPSGNVSLTTMTFNGDALTPVAASGTTSGCAMFYLVNPDVTTGNLVVTYNIGNVDDIIVGCGVYEGIAQTSTLGASSTTTTSGTGGSMPLTTTTDFPVVIGVCQVPDGTVSPMFTAGYAATKRVDTNNGSTANHISAYIGELLANSAGAYNVGFLSKGVSAGGPAVMGEFKKVTASGVFSPGNPAVTQYGLLSRNPMGLLGVGRYVEA